MADLDEFLWAVAARPFTWGESDCCLGFVGAWVHACRGGDPEAAWRGRYRTELGCARLLRREGDVLGVLTKAASAAGLPPQEQPTRGAIGVLSGPDGLQAGAICVGDAWAVRSVNGGVAIGQWPFIKAWEV